MENYKEKIQFVELKSDDAVKVIPKNLDFVYIDGNHEYEQVKRDIENYYPKLRKGGVLAGYDFCDFYRGVIQAVIEFCYVNKLHLMVEKTDWWVVKKDVKLARLSRY